MTVRNFVVRPQVLQAAKWDGTNDDEMKEFAATANGEISKSGDVWIFSNNYNPEVEVPLGMWIVSISLGYLINVLDDAEFFSRYSEVLGSAPFAYQVTGT